LKTGDQKGDSKGGGGGKPEQRTRDWGSPKSVLNRTVEFSFRAGQQDEKVNGCGVALEETGGGSFSGVEKALSGVSWRSTK